MNHSGVYKIYSERAIQLFGFTGVWCDEMCSSCWRRRWFSAQAWRARIERKIHLNAF